VKNKGRNERLDKISDALYSSPEDLTAADAAEDLEAAGVDREALHRRMYDKLCLLVQGYRLKGEEPPHHLAKAVEELRKKVGQPRTKEEFERRANSTVSKLLDRVRTRPSFGTATLAFGTHFRNQASQQSQEDQKIIENLEQELEKDLDEEKDNSD
jgi:hypothetical protein